MTRAEGGPADGLLVRVGPGPASGGVGGKRAAITRAATALFLDQGYRATSTEQIATAAGVSKQTVYNQFGDKDSLFREIVLGVTATAEAFVAELARSLDPVTTGDAVEPALRSLGRRYLTAVMSPRVLALRRLVISEAAHFPDLAATYYDRAPARVLDALAHEFSRLAGRGLIRVADPARAAADFAFLLLGRPLDEGMFRTADPRVDVEADTDHAVSVFLAAYPPLS